MAPHVIVYPTFRCGLSCPYCLDAHTKISVAKPGQAYKAIKNIKIGDKLRTWDGENIVETTVVNTMSRKVYSILEITTEAGSKVFATKEHPFNVKGNWVEAGKLKVGDEIIRPFNLLKAHGGLASVKKQIEKHGYLPFTRLPASDLQKETLRKRMLENNPMKNLESVIKRAKSCNKRPTNLEKWFSDNVFNDLPIKYVGSGDFWVDHRNPDFKVEGQKKVIEVSKRGYYGRGDEYIEDNQKHYTKHGFKVKTLLATRMNTEEATKFKTEIKQFIVNGDRIASIKKIKCQRRVYNLTCEPYPHYIAEGLWTHNCNWKTDGMSMTYTGGTKYTVEKELHWKDMLAKLSMFGTMSFEFTGGEPLKYDGIQSLLNALPFWSMTSNTLHSLEGINFKKCAGWTASYHPHVSDKAKDKFMSNIEFIKSFGIRTSVTMVATPQNLEKVLKDTQDFKKAGFGVNIHPYYDDCNFDWAKFPKEQEILMKNEFLRYADRFFNYGSVKGSPNCYAGKDYFVVAPDGFIYRCVTEMVFGGKALSNPSDSLYKCTRDCIVCCDWHYGIREGFNEIFAINADKFVENDLSDYELKRV